MANSPPNSSGWGHVAKLSTSESPSAEERCQLFSGHGACAGGSRVTSPLRLPVCARARVLRRHDYLHINTCCVKRFIRLESHRFLTRFSRFL